MIQKGIIMRNIVIKIRLIRLIRRQNQLAGLFKVDSIININLFPSINGMQMQEKGENSVYLFEQHKKNEA